MASSGDIPNLSVFFPVEILGCPPATTSGLILIEIFALIFFSLAISSIVKNS